MHEAIFALPFLVALGMITSGCDGFVAYQVDNETDRELETWILYADCEEIIGKRGEYQYARQLPPHSTVRVSEVTGSLPNTPWCLQVVDSDRQLVLAVPYTDTSGVSVAVREPVVPGPVIPLEEDLPGRSLGERFSEQPGGILFVLLSIVLGLGLLAAVAYAVFVIIRRARAGANPRHSS